MAERIGSGYYITDPIAELKAFVKLTEIAESVMSSDAEWEDKYNTIFSDSIYRQIEDTKVPFSKGYSDSSYENDVRNYVEHLRYKADQLEKIIQSVDEAMKE